MYSEKIKKEYERWCEKAEDADVAAELKNMAEDKDTQEDAFYKDLEFGTGGLRGVIGAGTNRMNVYTVAKASQGLADYVCQHNPEGRRSICGKRNQDLHLQGTYAYSLCILCNKSSFLLGRHHGYRIA